MLLARLPAHQECGDPTSTWVMERLLAVVRDTEAGDAEMDETNWEDCLVLVHDALLGGRLARRRETARRLERLDRLLLRFGLATFVGVLVVLALLLRFDNPWLTLVEAVLPA
jgi:hypothetical protein